MTCKKAHLTPLSLKCALSIFILMQPDELEAGAESEMNKGLTADQRSLLLYVRSFKAKKIGDLFVKTMNKANDDVSLADFEAQLRATFNSD